MIRRTVMLVLIVALFAYTCWNFYAKAVAYDPLAEGSVSGKKIQAAQEKPLLKYQQAWSAVIYEKNVFSPDRTYREARSVAGAAAEKPKQPEFVLKGIIQDRFGEHVAYIIIDKARPVAMRRGDKTGDIELVDVSNRRAVLKWYDELIDLSMERIKTIDAARGAK
ncbi:MAG: hypothetical protein M0Z79_03770 [Nitrospiraceae bacterium]|nr:hypothetical protein [Nitrospiraceae bacterium]